MLVRADDILVSGETDEQHVWHVDEVLARLKEAGLRAKLKKCRFMEEEVIFMGYIVSKDGHHPNPERIEALLKAPAPGNLAELQSYLGMVNYYAKFIPRLAAIVEPLHTLLQRGEKWIWTEEQEEALRLTKEKLCTVPVLTHYSPHLPIYLACDASPVGIRAVLSHILPDSSERPVAYASGTLVPAERNYSQFEREALSIMFGVRKFHNYIWGTPFTIITDHKPLLGVFGPDKPIPNMASSQMVRWTLSLQGYTDELCHKQG